MDIDAFITANRPTWQRLEQACKRGRAGLAKLSGPEIQQVVAAFQKVSADLSEVQTRYRDPQLIAYLSSVLAAASAAIYSARSRTAGGFVRVFGSRYRRAIHETRPYILVAAAVLAGVTVAFYLWILNSASARAGIIPPEARSAMRMAGGKRPDFGLRPESVSALIFFNNARVALLAFAGGITAGAFTLWMLATNGFIIGSLGAGYASVGKAGIFWALLLPHGLLELTAICISAGAGLRIGWAWVRPGDRLRARALAEEAAGAVVAVVGVIPAFLVAALIEGLVTGSAVPRSLQIAIGVVAEIAYLVLVFGLGRPQPEPEPGSS
jgi:uncharacterized membrane protein SpoIIM required for sporulation